MMGEDGVIIYILWVILVNIVHKYMIIYYIINMYYCVFFTIFFKSTLFIHIYQIFFITILNYSSYIILYLFT
jgi:hypothetical protein